MQPSELLKPGVSWLSKEIAQNKDDLFKNHPNLSPTLSKDVAIATLDTQPENLLATSKLNSSSGNFLPLEAQNLLETFKLDVEQCLSDPNVPAKASQLKNVFTKVIHGLKRLTSKNNNPQLKEEIEKLTVIKKMSEPRSSFFRNTSNNDITLCLSFQKILDQLSSQSSTNSSTTEMHPFQNALYENMRIFISNTAQKQIGYMLQAIKSFFNNPDEKASNFLITLKNANANLMQLGALSPPEEISLLIKIVGDPGAKISENDYIKLDALILGDTENKTSKDYTNVSRGMKVLGLDIRAQFYEDKANVIIAAENKVEKELQFNKIVVNIFDIFYSFFNIVGSKETISGVKKYCDDLLPVAEDFDGSAPEYGNLIRKIIEFVDAFARVKTYLDQPTSDIRLKNTMS